MLVAALISKYPNFIYFSREFRVVVLKCRRIDVQRFQVQGFHSKSETLVSKPRAKYPQSCSLSFNTSASLEGPRNFEPRSNDEDGTLAVTPSPNFRTTPAGGRLATICDLTCNRSHTWRIFNGIRFRTWSPPVPKPDPCH
ncbi:hypothetical protein AVEN_132871-1 [Araneus ventricosus]|uniref:Uncharacterized protein n=1 Tax=Araneus ventricosus TaxID=182803 RepID=A0A4Y2TVD0_ARAVE|nr:hypothetical protein AVEN_198610-1 [Araneus ventricosus]GBO03357.1 hypothetical protein AVEN_132871-1 [Araneus ventricosus]